MRNLSFPMNRWGKERAWSLPHSGHRPWKPPCRWRRPARARWRLPHQATAVTQWPFQVGRSEVVDDMPSLSDQGGLRSLGEETWLWLYVWSIYVWYLGKPVANEILTSTIHIDLWNGSDQKGLCFYWLRAFTMYGQPHSWILTVKGTTPQTHCAYQSPAFQFKSPWKLSSKRTIRW